jgi:hypothetical protein
MRDAAAPAAHPALRKIMTRREIPSDCSVDRLIMSASHALAAAKARIVSRIIDMGQGRRKQASCDASITKGGNARVSHGLLLIFAILFQIAWRHREI